MEEECDEKWLKSIEVVGGKWVFGASVMVVVALSREADSHR